MKSVERERGSEPDVLMRRRATIQIVETALTSMKHAPSLRASPRIAFLLFSRRDASSDTIVAITGDSRRMSEGEKKESAKSEASIDVARRRFRKKTPSPIESSSENQFSLTSGRDKFLVLLDGLDGPAELLPRGELLAGGRHGWEWWWGGGYEKKGKSLSLSLFLSFSRRTEKERACEREKLADQRDLSV